ncbi:hypothetical protein FO519_007622 [Halicephalobus sp. NKZ332]|nr:hypothetical protein FO519_007622 [Halicephalobus sp. NKZ332]
MILKLIFGLFFLTLISAAPEEDRVTSLPGTNFTVGFEHYSGYLNASKTKFFHYWFTKAQTDPDSSPVILWLNGGPGTSDDDVAQHNHKALVHFFTEKFPEYKNNDFYITGESYGGVYVPTLAVKVAADKTNFPHFKGIAIGNGFYSFPLNYNSLVPLLYYHSLSTQVLYEQVVQACCQGKPDDCDYYDQLDSETDCGNFLGQLFNEAPDINPYNLYSTCYFDGGSRSKKDFIYRTLREKSKLKSKSSPKPRAGDLPLCAQVNNTEVYLNKADVRKALHIPDDLPRWRDCSESVSFLYDTTHEDVKAEFQQLINAGIRILTYNGDVDTVCNFVLNKQFVNGLGLTIVGGTDSQEWFYHGETPNVGGFVTRFSNNVDFVTVRGSGHFVPEGYLNASDTKLFHYWFTKAQTDPDSSPVILWLNGGPASDDEVAQHNHNALVYFFTYKFPEFKNHDFYITGESYGGVYIPTLAVKVAADKTNFPHFKGIAISNGLYDIILNYNTRIPLYYYHGLIRQNLYDEVVTTCCNGNSYTCDYYSQWSGSNGTCSQLIDLELSQHHDLDIFNLYSTCYFDEGPGSKRNFIDKILKKKLGPKLEEKEEPRAGTLPLCAQVNNTAIYLNRADVRKALHVPDNLPPWVSCSDPVGDHYQIIHYNVYPEFHSLINSGIRILTWNGDVDTVCSFVLNKQFINKLGLTVLGGTDSQEWFYHGETPNVGGFITKFSSNVDFLTVRGSGHFIPQDKPREALQVIYNFIHQRDYSLPAPF